MSIADQSTNRWRGPLLLFLGVFVGVIIFAVLRNRSVDESRDAVTPQAEAPPSHSGNRVMISASSAPDASTRVNAAMQKPGPPDPVSEKTAAESAARAAEAAAALAESSPGVTH